MVAGKGMAAHLRLSEQETDCASGRTPALMLDFQGTEEDTQ